MHIRIAESDEALRRCFRIMVQLRPKLTEQGFIEQTRRQSEQGYRIAYVEDAGEPRAVAGYRVSERLADGRNLYVDDLVTDGSCRSKGYGEALFDWLVVQARAEGCAVLNLDSGVQRFDAHRFYLRKRMRISSHHFWLGLDSQSL